MNTTLCYIQHVGNYLMMLRNKKDHDVNQDKYVGVGGKFLPGETADECLVREVKEETGYDLSSFDFRGVVHFVSDAWEDEDMYLYTASVSDSPEPLPVPQCNEGTFFWIPIADVENLPTWEGDKYFLHAIAAGRHGIDMTLEYAGDMLVRVQDVSDSR